MKNDIMQKELFEEFEIPKKKKKISRSILPKNYIPFNLSYEQAIFIIIAVIMLLVLLFSLGVERGKHLILSGIKKQKDPSLETTTDIADLKKESAPESALNLALDRSKGEQVESPAVEEKKAANSKLFTIQVIAYRSKKLAQNELMKLKKIGFDPFIIVGGGYYQICVGEYRAQRECKDDLLKLRKIYKDSFVRKRGG